MEQRKRFDGILHWSVYVLFYNGKWWQGSSWLCTTCNQIRSNFSTYNWILFYDLWCKMKNFLVITSHLKKHVYRSIVFIKVFYRNVLNLQVDKQVKCDILMINQASLVQPHSIISRDPVPFSLPPICPFIRLLLHKNHYNINMKLFLSF